MNASATVQTQAFQLWLRESSKDLGWAYDSNSVAGCYVEPLDTYCDMTHLLPREEWDAEDDVRSIAYFCGVLDERKGETAADATARVKENATEFLRQAAGTLWPRGVSGDARSDIPDPR